MLLLHHRDERELRASGDAQGVEADIIKGMYLLKDASSEKNGNGKGKGKNIPYVQLLGSGTILREVDRRRRTARQGIRRRQRHLDVPELHRAAPRRLRRRALEPSASDGQTPRKAHVTAVPRRAAPVRRSPRPTTCANTPTRSARSCRTASVTSCSAPTASAAATRARTCARSSKSTATRSRTRQSPRWPRKAR